MKEITPNNKKRKGKRLFRKTKAVIGRQIVVEAVLDTPDPSGKLSFSFLIHEITERTGVSKQRARKYIREELWRLYEESKITLEYVKSILVEV